MLRRLSTIALTLALAGPALAQAQVTCKDGATAKGGRGACSHHGGVAVDQAAPPAPSKEASVQPAAKAAPKDVAQVTCKDGSTSAGGKGACSHHGGIAVTSQVAPAPMTRTAAPPPAPAPAPVQPAPTSKTARCKDGSMSFAKHHSGACSHHGGVAAWL